ncbi:MAG: acyl carrier protein [Kiritimatiellae bacterium]|nr:acyl carrier protein [Kiritimatiellia bacterium]
MPADDIVQKVNQVFCDTFELEPARLKPEAKLFDDLGLDSLDAVDLVASLKEECGVDLRQDPRVREIRTMGDVYRLVTEIVSSQK